MILQIFAKMCKNLHFVNFLINTTFEMGCIRLLCKKLQNSVYNKIPKPSPEANLISGMDLDTNFI